MIAELLEPPGLSGVADERAHVERHVGPDEHVVADHPAADDARSALQDVLTGVVVGRRRPLLRIFDVRPADAERIEGSRRLLVAAQRHHLTLRHDEHVRHLGRRIGQRRGRISGVVLPGVDGLAARIGHQGFAVGRKRPRQREEIGRRWLAILADAIRSSAVACAARPIHCARHEAHRRNVVQDAAEPQLQLFVSPKGDVQ